MQQCRLTMPCSMRQGLYYSMRGTGEKSQQCVGIFLGKLVDDARVDSRYYNYFFVVREMREKANYELSYSRENAEIALKFADAFIEKMSSLIR